MPSKFEHGLERHKNDQSFDGFVAEYLARRLGKTSPTGTPNPEEVKRLMEVVKKRVDEKMQKVADSWTGDSSDEK